MKAISITIARIKITPDYLARQGLSPTFEQRFWSKVRKTDRCWEWIGCKNPNGYGKIGKWKECDSPIDVHRASWILHFGPVPEGMCVLHRCDNRCCVRPEHLWLGTPKENTLDMMHKGRYVLGRRYCGEENANHRLTAKEVLEIRRRYATGKETQQYIANCFFVSQTLVGSIVRMEIWRHVVQAI